MAAETSINSRNVGNEFTTCKKINCQRKAAKKAKTMNLAIRLTILIRFNRALAFGEISFAFIKLKGWFG
jgi:hypothetical protein